MSNKVGDTMLPVEHYKLKIKSKEADLEKAAQIGKQLLVDKQQLEEKLHDLQSENESLKQRVYSLQLDIEAKSKTLDSHSFESEHLFMQQEKSNKLQNEIIALKQTIKSLKHEICDQEELQKENNNLISKINDQKEQIDILQQRIDSFVNATIIEEETDEDDLNYFKLKNAQLQEILSGYQIELDKLKLDEGKLKDIIKSQEEIIQEKETLTKSYFAEIKEAREEATELKCEIEMLKLQQVDLNQKGNSMFGELDDRRLVVEKHCKKVEEKYKILYKEHKESLQELKYCKSQLAVLPSQLSCTNRTAHIEKLERQLQEAKNTIADLTNELQKSVKLQQKLKSERPPVPQGNEYNYLKVMYEQSEKNVKVLEKETMLLRLQVQSYTDSMSDTQRQLYRCQEEAQALRTDNAYLRQRTEELASQLEAHASSVGKPDDEPVGKQVEKAASNCSINKDIYLEECTQSANPRLPKSSSFAEVCIHCGAHLFKSYEAVRQTPAAKDNNKTDPGYDTADDTREIKCPVQ